MVKQIFKFIFLICLSCTALLANLYFENNFRNPNPLKVFATGQISEKKIEKNLDAQKENKIAPGSYITGEKNNPRTALNFLHNNEEGSILRIEEGSYWVNNRASTRKINLLIGKNLLLIPKYANFQLEYKEQTLKLEVYSGDIYLGIINPEIKLKTPQDEFSEFFLNNLIVGQNNSATIYLEKIDQRMYSLLPSKLAKEFRIFPLSENRKLDKTISQKLKNDQIRLNTYKKEIINTLLERSRQDFTNGIGENINKLKLQFIFIPEKRETVILDQIEELVNTAILKAGERNIQESEFYLKKVDALKSQLSNEGLQRFYSRGFFRQLTEELALSIPGENLYDLALEIYDREFFKEGEQKELLPILWNDVYQVLKNNPSLADRAMNEYYRHLEATLDKSEEQSASTLYRHLQYQNQLFANLFLNYATYYSEKYFLIKSMLETKLLENAPNFSVKVEISQDLIAEKLDYLRRLMAFFFENNLEVSEAQKITALLIGEINNLMNDKSQTAVVELFNAELQEITDFWGYLDSPEYNEIKAYGMTHRERYAVYLQERKEIWSIINLQKEVLGDSFKKNLTVDDVREEIKDIFKKSNSQYEIMVGQITKAEQRYVPITGSVNGYPFKGEFDRNYSTLNNVEAYGEKIGDRPIKIENLGAVVEAKFFPQVSNGKPETELNEETKNRILETSAQRLAKAYLAQEIGQYNFEITEKNFLQVDNDKAIYRVEKIALKDLPKVTASFDYSANTEKAKNIYLEFDGKSLLLQEEMTIKDLATLMESGAYLNQIKAEESPVSR